MTTYSVHFLCNECGLMHSVAAFAAIENGPDKKVSLGELFEDNDMPGEVADAKSDITRCCETEMSTSQEDNNKIFLVPMALSNNAR